MLSASLIQLEYASKHWKSTFSYFLSGGGSETLIKWLYWHAKHLFFKSSTFKIGTGGLDYALVIGVLLLDERMGQP